MLENRSLRRKLMTQIKGIRLLRFWHNFCSHMEIIKPAEFLSFLDRTLIGKLQSWLQGNGNQKIRGAVIGQAVVLATVGIFLYKMMTPPAQLRHLPTINPLRLMYSFVSKEEPGSRANRLVLPTVLKHHSKGYVVSVAQRNM